jgi:hypothetical protein
MKKPPSIEPFKWTALFRVPFGVDQTKLFLYPTRLDMSGTLTGLYSESINTNSTNPSSSTIDFSGSMNSSFKIFESLQGSYNFTTRRDLRDPETVILKLNPKEFKLGVEQSYGQNFRASYSPSIFNFLTHKFNYSATYGDTYRAIGDTASYHGATSKVSSDIGFTFRHESLIGSNKGSQPRRGKRKINPIQPPQADLIRLARSFTGSDSSPMLSNRFRARLGAAGH